MNHSFQTATALGKLGHPDGELNLTRAAAKHGVIQMVSYRGWIAHTFLIPFIDSHIGFVFF